MARLLTMVTVTVCFTAVAAPLASSCRSRVQNRTARVITTGSDIVHMLEGEISAPSRSVIREGAPHLVSPKSRVL